MAGEFVVGIGGDGSGQAAAFTAARVASLVKAPVVLVFGYESSPLGPRGGPLEERVADVGSDATAEVKERLLALYPDLDVQVELVAQRPADALIEVAQSRQAEIIAIGHGGQGPLRAALLGSVTYEVVHRAPLPVLVVPDDPEDG